MKMLSVNFRLYISLAFLLAVFCHAQTPELSHHGNTTVHGLNDGTRCGWNCTDIDNYLMQEMKTIIAKNKIIRLAVKYEVMNKCVNQTSGNSSGYIEHLQIWRANKQPSVFRKALENVVNFMSRTDLVEERKEIKAICTLRPVNTTPTESTDYNGSSPIFSRSHLADLGVKLDSIDCTTETVDNLQPCISITKSTGNNSSNSEGPLKRGGWPVKVLFFLQYGFIAVFIYYSPAFLCVFSPTEVTEDGVHQIVLDGASPVGLRSPMGNYFFSKEDTIWHRVRMFILRAVVFPFPFLCPAMFGVYVQPIAKEFFGTVPHLLQPVMIVSYVCYYIVACCISFCPPSSSGGNHFCIVCKVHDIISETHVCQENLPEKIRIRLRVYPLILVNCWRLFTRLVMTYFKRCFVLIPSTFEFSSFFFLRLFLLIVSLSASPAVTIVLLILILLLTFSALMFTCPMFAVLFCGGIIIPRFCFRRNRYLFGLSFSVYILISITAYSGTYAFLRFAASGVFLAMILAFELLLREDSLPFVAYSVLVLYYLWSSYSSFTNKYQDLGLALFKHCKGYRN